MRWGGDGVATVYFCLAAPLFLPIRSNTHIHIRGRPRQIDKGGPQTQGRMSPPFSLFFPSAMPNGPGNEGGSVGIWASPRTSAHCQGHPSGHRIGGAPNEPAAASFPSPHPFLLSPQSQYLYLVRTSLLSLPLSFALLVGGDKSVPSASPSSFHFVLVFLVCVVHVSPLSEKYACV